MPCNMHQCLGHTLDDPSEFALCWTADGAQSEADVNSKTGGTGTAIRLASQRGIPVFNLAREGAEGALLAFLAQRRAERMAAQTDAGAPAHEEDDEAEGAEPRRNILRFPTR
jgi:hypothetical protein